MGWPKYRGTRGGKAVQQKRQENKWREQGWEKAEDGEWTWQSSEPWQERQEWVEEESEDLPARSRTPSRVSSRREAELEEAAQDALRHAAAEEKRRKALEAEVKRLRQELKSKVVHSTGDSAPSEAQAASSSAQSAAEGTYVAPVPAAPFPETEGSIRTQESLVTVEVTESSSHSRESSDQSIGSLHSRWSSGQSEVLAVDRPVLTAVHEEADVDMLAGRTSTQRGRRRDKCAIKGSRG